MTKAGQGGGILTKNLNRVLQQEVKVDHAARRAVAAVAINHFSHLGRGEYGAASMALCSTHVGGTREALRQGPAEFLLDTGDLPILDGHAIFAKVGNEKVEKPTTAGFNREGSQIGVGSILRHDR